MQRLQLASHTLEWVVRTARIGDDEQVVLGDDAVRQVELVEQQLQAGLEPHAFQRKLHGIVHLQSQAIERGTIDHDGSR